MRKGSIRKTSPHQAPPPQQEPVSLPAGGSAEPPPPQPHGRAGLPHRRQPQGASKPMLDPARGRGLAPKSGKMANPSVGRWAAPSIIAAVWGGTRPSATASGTDGAAVFDWIRLERSHRVLCSAAARSHAAGGLSQPEWSEA